MDKFIDVRLRPRIAATITFRKSKVDEGIKIPVTDVSERDVANGFGPHKFSFLVFKTVLVFLVPWNNCIIAYELRLVKPNFLPGQRVSIT